MLIVLFPKADFFKYEISQNFFLLFSRFFQRILKGDFRKVTNVYPPRRRIPHRNSPVRKAFRANIFMANKMMPGRVMALTAAPMSVVLSEVDDGGDVEDDVGVGGLKCGLWVICFIIKTEVLFFLICALIKIVNLVVVRV